MNTFTFILDVVCSSVHLCWLDLWMSFESGDSRERNCPSPLFFRNQIKLNGWLWAPAFINWVWEILKNQVIWYWRLNTIHSTVNYINKSNIPKNLKQKEVCINENKYNVFHQCHRNKYFSIHFCRLQTNPRKGDC